jgi:PAS domain-containing protein
VTELRTHAEELHALTRRLVQMQEDERRAISRDLHDTSGQALTFLGMGLAVLQREPGLSAMMQAQVEQMRRVVQSTAEELSRLAAQLRPAMLDRYGLAPALEQVLAATRSQSGVELTLQIEGLEERLPTSLETALFRIVQEGCTNITRYAEARTAAVALCRDRHAVRLTIEDDGQGFDVAEALGRGRLGLLGIRERVEMFAGQFKIDSSPGHGTRLTVVIPFEEFEAAGNARANGTRTGHALPTVAPEPAAPRVTPAAELARAKALSDALVELMAGMARQETPEALLAFVLATSAEAIGCESANIVLRDGEDWVIRYGYRLPESALGHRLSVVEAPTDTEVARTREVVVIDDTRTVRQYTALGNYWSALSLAAVPLVAHDRVLGVANFAYHSAPVPFKPSEVAFLKRMSVLVSLALENIELRRVEAEQAARLARRVEELQAVLDVLPVGVGIAYDPACQDIRVNRAFAGMLDIPPDANASLTADEAERPANFKVYKDGQELAPEELPMQVAATEGREVRELVVDVVRDDGRVLTLLEYAAPLFDADGKPRGAVGAFVDITGQRTSPPGPLS